MNLELIKNTVQVHISHYSELTVLNQIRDARRALRLIQKRFDSGIARLIRTGNVDDLQEASADLEAFLNPESFEPTYSSDPAVATIEADGELTYSNE